MYASLSQYPYLKDISSFSQVLCQFIAVYHTQCKAHQSSFCLYYTTFNLLIIHLVNHAYKKIKEFALRLFRRGSSISTASFLLLRTLLLRQGDSGPNADQNNSNIYARALTLVPEGPVYLLLQSASIVCQRILYRGDYSPDTYIILLIIVLVKIAQKRKARVGLILL